MSKTTLNNLIDRFFELDITNDGYLDVGVDCPSADQVEELHAETEGTTMSLADAWRRKQAGLVEYEMKVRRAGVFAQKWKKRSSVRGSAAQIEFARHPTQSFDDNQRRGSLGDPKDGADLLVNIVANTHHRARYAAEEAPPQSKGGTSPEIGRSPVGGIGLV